MSNMNVAYNADLIGLDLETGGLNGYQEDGNHGAKHYPILEIAIVLPEVAETGLLTVPDYNQFVVGIAMTAAKRKAMHPWARDQHLNSGLLDRLKTGEGFDYVAGTPAQAEDAIISWLKERGVEPFDREKRTGAILYGNNISFDHSFLDAQMPKLAAYFHYRKIDVSAINVLARSLWAEHNFPMEEKQLNHTALSDILESTEELNRYTKHLNGKSA